MENDMLQRILKNKVKVKQTFNSYAALCAFIGLPKNLKGKQRQIQQEQLQCFIEWSRQPGRNQITVTKTFYEAPRERKDNRNGVHTTKLGNLMQELVMMRRWEDPVGYSKRSMLQIMRVINSRTDGGVPSRMEEVHYDYYDKVNKLLESALTQLEKKGKLVTKSVVVQRDTGEVLPDEEAQSYRALRKKLLVQYSAPSIVHVFRRKIEQGFWRELDAATMETMNRKHLSERIIITKKDAEEKVADGAAFVKEVGATLSDNYEKKNKGAIGCKAPQAYRKKMEGLVESIIASNFIP